MPTTKVILTKDVEKLGKRGDIKSVSAGFARNMLLPKQMAVLASKSAVKEMEHQKELEARQAEEELHLFQELASQIDGYEVEIPAKVGKDGKLFGSVTSANIADAMTKQGYKLAKDQIKLKEPIKELGEYDVSCELPHGLEAKIKVIVIEEEASI